MDVFFCFMLYGIIFLKSLNSCIATGHLPALSVPGVGHLQILRCPGAGHLPTFACWHARGFLLEYNYTEDFTRKTSRFACLSRTGKNWRGLKRHVLDFMHAFLHCLSSQNNIAELGSYRRESSDVVLVIESCFLILFEEHPFIFIKLFIAVNFMVHY